MGECLRYLTSWQASTIPLFPGMIQGNSEPNTSLVLYLEPHSAISFKNSVVECASSDNLGHLYKVSPFHAKQPDTLFTDEQLHSGLHSLVHYFLQVGKLTLFDRLGHTFFYDRYPETEELF